MRAPLATLALIVASACSGCQSDPSPAGPDAAPGPDAGGHPADASTPTGDAAAAAPDDLASILEPIRSSNGLPALGAAVFRGGKLIAIGVSGARKLGDPTPVTVDDRWHLGSDTKAMTSTLIGIAVDRGQIHLDDTLATLFQGETVHPGYAQVRLIELLQHRGGAPANVPPDIWSQMWADGAAPGARLKAVRAMLARAPEQPRGTYAYANAGYMMAGVALERVTGSTWEALLQKDVFAPLHMASCGFGAPGSPNTVEQPWGHHLESGKLTPVAPGPQADNPPSLGPAGTVHCSLADWGRFLAVHVAGARHEKTIVSDAVMARLQTPYPGGDYAAGWIVAPRSWAGALPALTHTGSNTLWFATAWLAPSKDVAFAVVTNRADGMTPAAVDSVFGPLIQRYAP